MRVLSINILNIYAIFIIKVIKPHVKNSNSAKGYEMKSKSLYHEPHPVVKSFSASF